MVGKTLLIDGMHCLYNSSFELNASLLDVLNSFAISKILVVNGFREKGKETIARDDFDYFSLEEKGIKKTAKEYFEILIKQFQLDISDILYIDHSEENIQTAKEFGIQSFHYTGNISDVKEFLEKNS